MALAKGLVVSSKNKEVKMNLIFNISRLLSVLTACLLLAACTDSEPMRALKGHDFKEKYNLVFWLHEAQSATSLWQQALDICTNEKYLRTPNCRFVIAAKQINTEKMPVYGQGHGFGAIDIRTNDNA